MGFGNTYEQSKDVRSGTFVFTLVLGALVFVSALYVSAKWESLTTGRRTALAALSGLFGLVLFVEWDSEAEPVSLRDIMLVLGALIAIVGAYAVWRARAGSEDAR